MLIGEFFDVLLSILEVKSTRFFVDKSQEKMQDERYDCTLVSKWNIQENRLKRKQGMPAAVLFRRVGIPSMLLNDARARTASIPTSDMRLNVH